MRGYIVNVLRLFAAFAIAMATSGCAVHEWPDLPENVPFHLRLSYDTDMIEWIHVYDNPDIIEQGLGETYDNHRSHGKIRYIVRAYPISERARATYDYTNEFIFHDVKINAV